MEYNPFTQKYNYLSSRINKKNSDKAILVDELKWFDSNNISTLSSSLKEMVTSSNNYNRLIDVHNKEIEIINANIQDTQKKTKTLFNPLNWFDDIQKKYRKKTHTLITELKTVEDHKKKSKRLLATTVRSMANIRSNIEKHKNFNRKKINNDISNLNNEVVLLEAQLQKVSTSKHTVDVALKPIIKQIKEYKSNISVAKEKIIKVQRFEHNLDMADNSYERAMIHEECEKLFGDGRPKKIIRQLEGTIRRFERDLDKAQKRALIVGEKSSRDIKRIIIDGNNMCYEGNKFVGLDPLIASAQLLLKKYKVTIIFDSAIRSQSKSNDQIIREQFNRNIKIHVVATKQLADETILDVASDDDTCFILSNDRFGEYNEKEAVKNNRLIRHEIVDRKVIIHDLNINVRYG